MAEEICLNHEFAINEDFRQIFQSMNSVKIDPDTHCVFCHCGIQDASHFLQQKRMPDFDNCYKQHGHMWLNLEMVHVSQQDSQAFFYALCIIHPILFQCQEPWSTRKDRAVAGYHPLAGYSGPVTRATLRCQKFAG